MRRSTMKTTCALIICCGIAACSQTNRHAAHTEPAGVSAASRDLSLSEDTQSTGVIRLASHTTAAKVRKLSDDGEWWKGPVQQSMRPTDRAVKLTVDDLLIRALKHSSQIKVFSDLPQIRETAIVEAEAGFDWNGFLESRFDDINDPVGSTLTVGGTATRFNDHNFTNALGVRKRTRYGGQLEVAQRLGLQDTNSTFFVPNPQGTARLVLSYSHPLLRGSGKAYNESLIVLANIDTQIAKEEFSRQLQSHLLEVVRAYWGLYYERGSLAQKTRSYERAKKTLDRLKGRRKVDAVASQIVSAEAEVASRQSDLRRAQMAVKNAEDRIRALVNDPELAQLNGVEMIPVDTPSHVELPVKMETALASAMEFRPELKQTLKQIQAASVRVNMSENELLPALNLITQAYVSGLQDDGSVGDAFTDQFTVGGPSYSIGLAYEVPFGNRAARARHIRRHLELRQLQNQYRTTLETLGLETRVAVRELQTSFNELTTKAKALKAMKNKVDFIERRWQMLPGDRSANLVLEDLLSAQANLTRAEDEYLKSLVTYNLAQINLKRATGELLQHENVAVGRGTINKLPTTILDKLPKANTPSQPGRVPQVPPAINGQSATSNRLPLLFNEQRGGGVPGSNGSTYDNP